MFAMDFELISLVIRVYILLHEGSKKNLGQVKNLNLSTNSSHKRRIIS